MMNFKFAFAAFLACIALGDALKCYSCQSGNRAACGKAQVEGTISEVECDVELGCLSYSDGMGMVYRGCGEVKPPNRDEMCETIQEQQCTSCFEDLCNIGLIHDS